MASCFTSRESLWFSVEIPLLSVVDGESSHTVVGPSVVGLKPAGESPVILLTGFALGPISWM